MCVCVCVVSLPKLKELDWRVDMVTGSDSVSRMSVPTCLVQFKVSEEQMSLLLVSHQSSIILENRHDPRGHLKEIRYPSRWTTRQQVEILFLR